MCDRRGAPAVTAGAVAVRIRASAGRRASSCSRSRRCCARRTGRPPRCWRRWPAASTPRTEPTPARWRCSRAVTRYGPRARAPGWSRSSVRVTLGRQEGRRPRPPAARDPGPGALLTADARPTQAVAHERRLALPMSVFDLAVVGGGRRARPPRPRCGCAVARWLGAVVVVQRPPARRPSLGLPCTPRRAASRAVARRGRRPGSARARPDRRGSGPHATSSRGSRAGPRHRAGTPRRARLTGRATRSPTCCWPRACASSCSPTRPAVAALALRGSARIGGAAAAREPEAGPAASLGDPVGLARAAVSAASLRRAVVHRLAPAAGAVGAGPPRGAAAPGPMRLAAARATARRSVLLVGADAARGRRAVALGLAGHGGLASAASRQRAADLARAGRRRRRCSTSSRDGRPTSRRRGRPGARPAVSRARRRGATARTRRGASPARPAAGARRRDGRDPVRGPAR